MSISPGNAILHPPKIDERGFRVTQNRVPRKIFGPNRRNMESYRKVNKE
jgi:hypothetical protein